ncbi:hypothetical protein SGLAD_v1c00740 [Spiroplasma gladiatoris]|uniref:Uncharacterized protein n=1 Tax=Spiroplasma gladiatoris TaxID=2143 RepID=A0A4P7AG12_9MOLU|nr:hypothetical protein [Spiroplasma gladiatoris]QBQ07275.1 hypothetical protein SGLAD_v1c00740 [Spiroplasma gladiatoris]
MNKKTEKFFYIWLSIMPPLGILFEIICLIIWPETLEGKKTSYFDIAVMYEFRYATIWVSVFTMVYGILNWIKLDHNIIGDWVARRNFLTTITTLSFVESLVYNSAFVAYYLGLGEIASVETWYNILKAVMEHFVTPTIILIFYFICKKNTVDNKTYIKKYSWLNLIFIFIYSTYMIFRSFMIINFFEDWENNSLMAFPYPQLNPYTKGWGLYIFGIISTYIATWLISVTLNFLINYVDKKKLYKKNNVK